MPNPGVMAYVGWAVTLLVGLPLLFITINCAVDWFVGWVNKGRF